MAVSPKLLIIEGLKKEGSYMRLGGRRDIIQPRRSPKRVIGIMDAILAARKLAQYVSSIRGSYIGSPHVDRGKCACDRRCK